MKHPLRETLEIPQGITCTIEKGILSCSKDTQRLSRSFIIPGVVVKIENSALVFECKAGNKKTYACIKSAIAHAINLFSGLQQKYIYKLEACNVHFPMMLKVTGDTLVITNFLGEKIPRTAKILSGVEIDMKGTRITLSSHDKEAAGQTAANIERATKIKNRDRRIFQDGIFIVEKPGAGI